MLMQQQVSRWVQRLSDVRTSKSTRSETFQLPGLVLSCCSAIYRDGDATNRDVDRLMDKAIRWSVRPDNATVRLVGGARTGDSTAHQRCSLRGGISPSTNVVESILRYPECVSMVRAGCVKTGYWRPPEAAAGRRCVSGMSRRGRDGWGGC
jgi:hypothetical protein